MVESGANVPQFAAIAILSWRVWRRSSRSGHFFVRSGCAGAARSAALSSRWTPPLRPPEHGVPGEGPDASPPTAALRPARARGQQRVTHSRSLPTAHIPAASLPANMSDQRGARTQVAAGAAFGVGTDYPAGAWGFSRSVRSSCPVPQQARASYPRSARERRSARGVRRPRPARGRGCSRLHRRAAHRP